MFTDGVKIPIQLFNKEVIYLTIFPDTSNTLFKISQNEAFENGESPIQIVEGFSYEFNITKGYNLESSEVVSHSKINKGSGRINPNIYVGTLTLNIVEDQEFKRCGELNIEVRSVKTSYRSDYRLMLEEITDKCVDLLLMQNSPVNQNLITDYEKDSSTLYQRFSFVKSIINSEEFKGSISKIISEPVTSWSKIIENKDIRALKRITSKSLRQILSSGKRVELPKVHPLYNSLRSLPSELHIAEKKDSVNNSENRFVKHVLSSFSFFCGDIKRKSRPGSRLHKEAVLIEQYLEKVLNHSLFKEISELKFLSLNSPVLQRKEGYREVLRAWLMFDLAAKLIWKGGNDVYNGGKRDVAVLYEYWLFFKLLEVFEDIFEIDPVDIYSLIEETNDGLGLKLKQGKHIPLKGTYNRGIRRLNIQFNYNKSFKGNSKYFEIGSWTRPLRPDYTLTVWPFGITQAEAVKEELIVYIHFDAKYKIENLTSIFGNNEIDLSAEKENQKKGNFKRSDLMKMHTYRDAIRRTAGAYVLYPGIESNVSKGFHEILPGLGAFPIRPSKQDNGTTAFKHFITDVVNHFLNRASQRERLQYRTYEILKSENINIIREEIPETYGKNRGLIPDETNVLICFYRSEDHFKWILNSGLYNARTETDRGSLKLGAKEASAKYLLLHTTGETTSNKLLKVLDRGPKIFSRQKLIDLNYPTTPTQEFYLMYRITNDIEKEFTSYSWAINRLEEFKSGRQSAIPFAITLSELMKVALK